MRSGASTSYKVIKNLNKNIQVEVLKKVNNSWYQIKYGTNTGYISSKYLKISTISSDNKNGTITGSVNMRTGPSTSYKIVTKLKSKDKVEIIYKTSQRYFKWKEGWYELKNYLYVPVSPSLDKIKSNTWCKIKYNGKVGYVNSKYITITNGSSTGLSFSKMDDKMIDLGYESFDGYEVLGYNYGFRNEHLADKYNIFDTFLQTDKKGFYVEIIEFTEGSRKPLKQCLNLLLPTKSDEVYDVIKELATTNGMRDNYRRLYVDGRTIGIHKYTGSSTIIVIEN